MKKYIPMLAIVILVAACKKNRKYCWQCHFSITEASAKGPGIGLDTNVCDMTEAESKDFQQTTVRRLKQLDTSGNQYSWGSACYKAQGK